MKLSPTIRKPVSKVPYRKPAPLGKIRKAAGIEIPEGDVPTRKLKTIFKSGKRVRATKTKEQPEVEAPKRDPRFDFKPIKMVYTTPPNGSEPGPFTSVLFLPPNYGGFSTRTIVTGKEVDAAGIAKQITKEIPFKVRGKVALCVRVTDGDDRNGYGVVHHIPEHALTQKPYGNVSQIEVGTKIRFAGGTALTPAKCMETYA